MKRYTEESRYLPIVFRQDFTNPTFPSNLSNYDEGPSPTSRRSEYYNSYAEISQYFEQVRAHAGKRRNALTDAALVDAQVAEALKAIAKEDEYLYKKAEEQKQVENSEKRVDDFDFLSFPETPPEKKKNRKKKKKPFVKYDEDEIHTFKEDVNNFLSFAVFYKWLRGVFSILSRLMHLFKKRLKEFLIYKFVPGEFLDENYTNEKENELRRVIVLFKHPHLFLNALKIKNFYIPLYVRNEHILDRKNAQTEFHDWKDFLLKVMEVRGNDGDYCHLSNGLSVTHFGQVPRTHNILVVGSTPELNFWHDFQKHYGFYLNFEQLREFIIDLNILNDRDLIYSTLISLSLIQNKLLAREEKRMVVREERRILRFERRQLSLPHFRSVRKYNESNGAYAPGDRRLKFKKLKINTLMEEDDLRLERIEKKALRLQKARDIVYYQIRTSKASLFRKFKSQRPQRLSNTAGAKVMRDGSITMTHSVTTPLLLNYSAIVKTYAEHKKYGTATEKYNSNKKKSELRLRRFTWSKLPHLETQTPKLSAERSQQLIGLYGHYTDVMRAYVLTEKAKKHFNFGSIMKSFNGVRMRIMYHSLPLVAQSKIYLPQKRTMTNGMLKSHSYSLLSARNSADTKKTAKYKTNSY